MQNINKIETLIDLYPNQLWLEFSEEEKQKYWQRTAEHSYDLARFRSYLNDLSAHTMLRWLEEEELEQKPIIHPSTLFKLNSIWEFVNGTTIMIGTTKIVLIPTDDYNSDDFIVPAEWVDIVGWDADYYLSVEVNLRDNWLRVRGYTTHEQIRNIGKMDIWHRNYILSQDDLIEDLNIMWVARELSISEKLPVFKVSSCLTERLSLTLINQLATKYSYFLRFITLFADWAVFIAHDDSRQLLYQSLVTSAQDSVPHKPETRC
ncbi:DUF1822 family protein (plasmid) [Cyanobacterium sp. IPPAS B-1200]|uniref:DUF1822 family protein n=1 Tax=Cyanobacterium sp. IPPAS B-1200 TaxID=1562720 RepID=UPI0008525D52|nr:DUF1822 family protein [Cyanobacterium sp. IPPAS B-1200]OEJ80003.1 hypothetical protein A5482_07660 [Cyanobacterium sp. IPPAS B-1200]